jgi:uncharacterized membrane protein YcaP (DUF421 family)
MSNWAFSNWSDLVVAAAKASSMYVVALVGLRVGPRRTLAQWTAIDFAAAVAVGAIVGRTALARDQSLAVGAVALLTVLLAHWLVSVLRFYPRFARAVDHRVRVLVEHGSIRHDQLRRCGITEDDLFARLREDGVRGIDELRYVLLETKGELTLVREASGQDGETVRRGLRHAAGFSADRRG